MSAPLQGRVIRAGQASGVALVSSEPISFYGGVDPDSGEIVEADHPCQGERLGGRVLVMPTGKGSTVGSWILLRLARNGHAPAAILCGDCDTVVAVGAILAEIPCLDQLDWRAVEAGQPLAVDGDTVHFVDTEGGERKP